MDMISVIFGCSPETAFRYLIEPRNRPHWQSSLRQVVSVDPGEPHVGMRWRDETVLGIKPHMELTRIEPYRVWTEVGVWRAVTAELTLHFVAVPEGTRVEATMSIEGRGWGRAASKVAQWMAPRSIASDLERAAALLSV